MTCIATSSSAQGYSLLSAGVDLLVRVVRAGVVYVCKVCKFVGDVSYCCSLRRLEVAFATRVYVARGCRGEHIIWHRFGKFGCCLYHISGTTRVPGVRSFDWYCVVWRLVVLD